MAIPAVGAIAACGVALGACLQLWRPAKQNWLTARGTNIGLICVSSPALLMSVGLLTAEQKAEQARADAIVAEQSRLASLRATDPQAYLTELQVNDSSRYETELALLDRPAYDKLIADRAKEQKQRNAMEVSKLKAELESRNPKTIWRKREIYKRLSELEGEEAYRWEISELDEKIAKEESARAQQRAKERAALAQRRNQRENPLQFVKLVDFNWRIDGFGTVMVASFKIKHNLPWPVKDFTIHCVHSAASGTQIDSNTQVIYERTDPGKMRNIRDVNMGFIHNQAARSNCQIMNLDVVGSGRSAALGSVSF